MIALVKDVIIIGLQIIFQNPVLSVNQNIGIAQERKRNNKNGTRKNKSSNRRIINKR